MLKTYTHFFLAAFSLTFACCEGAENSSMARKVEVIREDQLDGTDTYAIPLDESNVEDERQINRAARKEVFSVPGK